MVWLKNKIVEKSQFIDKNRPTMSTLKTVPGLGWARMPSTFQLGEKTMAVPMGLHRSTAVINTILTW